MTNKNENLNTEQWWEATGIRFECIACGKCCGGAPGFIWVNEEEKEGISKFLNIDAIELDKLYLIKHMGKSSIKERDNFDCIFLDSKSNRCKIYKVRPMQCSLFPFWPSLLADKRLWNYYSARCPGMDNGKHYTAEMIRKMNQIDADDRKL